MKKTILATLSIVVLLSLVFLVLKKSTKKMVSQDLPQAMEQMATKVPDGYIDLSPTEAVDLIEENPDLVIIDVSPKYEEGHLPGAVNYYVGDGSLDEAIPNLDPEAVYLIYCHVDSAAIAGAQKLVDAGFTKVYRLTGNYSAWRDSGYPTEK